MATKKTSEISEEDELAQQLAWVNLVVAAGLLRPNESPEEALLLHQAGVDRFKARRLFVAGCSLDDAIRIHEARISFEDAAQFLEAGGSVVTILHLKAIGAYLPAAVELLKLCRSDEDVIRLHASGSIFYGAAEFLEAGGSVDDLLRLLETGGTIYDADKLAKGHLSLDDVLPLLAAAGKSSYGVAEFLEADGSVEDGLQLLTAGANLARTADFLEAGGSVEGALQLLASGSDLIGAAEFLDAGGSLDDALRLLSAGAHLSGAAAFLAAGGAIDDAHYLQLGGADLASCAQFLEAGGSTQEAIYSQARGENLRAATEIMRQERRKADRALLEHAGAAHRDADAFLQARGTVNDGLRLLTVDHDLYSAVELLRSNLSIDDALLLAAAGASLDDAMGFIDDGGTTEEAQELLTAGVSLEGAAQFLRSGWSVAEVIRMNEMGLGTDDQKSREEAAKREDLSPTEIELLSRDPESDVREALASSLFVPPEILERFARDSEDSEYRYAAAMVASNPNASPALIATLIGQVPEWSLFRNPAVTAETLRGLVAVLTEVGGLQGRDTVAAEIASYPRTPTDALAHLVSENPTNVAICKRAATNSNVSPETLVTLARNGDASIQALVASQPMATLDVINLVKASRNVEVLRALASRADLPEDLRAKVIENLAKAETKAGQKNDAADDLYEELSDAGNGNTPPERLAELAKSKSAKVRLLIAARTDAPLDSLTSLAADKSAAIRREVALNTSCPQVARDILADDKTWDVREALTPGAIYSAVLTSEDVTSLLKQRIAELRLKGAMRAFELGLLSEASLRNRLPVSGRTISWVQERAYSTLSEPLRAVLGTLELQPGYRIVIPETPGKVPIKRGSKGMDTHKAWDLASNPSATADELALAATAPSHSHVEYEWDEQAPDVPGQIRASGVTWEVGGDSVTRFPQILVALHPNTSADTLILLRKARSKHVRAALAQRPDLHALPILVRDKDPLVRRAVAEQEACPVELLAVLSLDPDIAVRSAASVHPQATDEIRAQAAILGIK
ncbi:MAG: hypothetical protein NTZ03_02220 [Actinobacteria bacterium]|nr:hypothetical protein [Actinomycetota bacterium]